ncbi:hypothetical protein M885DRAFT_512796 [Pelagophyceae sp. CCMP2097]|nr:hypothetical protein M885DRAFT_512796 [Pelagophyceae sp. CCMP2097]|mmetsp:Transcript_19714/g.66697  ORF Transcript_19714/g.66697 Transcript_19714/m.66697 type:complete len:486 (-) Transcript_19714:13-1470(-)
MLIGLARALFGAAAPAGVDAALVDAFLAGCRLGGLGDCEAEAFEWSRRRLGEAEELSLMSGAGLLNLCGTVLCITSAGLAAGLTMGILSLDPMDLRVKIRAGTPDQQRDCAKLLGIVEREPRHQVMVTLLLLNSISNEALPLFLDKLVAEWLAILISVTAVLFVGEIIPSAIFTGPAKLQIASRFVWFVRLLVVLFSPIAYPLALVLDRCIREEKNFTSRYEMAARADVEREHAEAHGHAEPFSADEAALVRGTMSLSSSTVKDVMVPVDSVYSIPRDAVCDGALLRELVRKGFSRVPLRAAGPKAKPNAFSGDYLLVKDLVAVSAAQQLPVRETGATRPAVWVRPDESLFDLLNTFQTGTSHIAFVSAGPGTPMLGVITLEDILEEIMTEEIWDETDVPRLPSSPRPSGRSDVLQARPRGLIIENKRRLVADGEAPSRRPGIVRQASARRNERQAPLNSYAPSTSYEATATTEDATTSSLFAEP